MKATPIGRRICALFFISLLFTTPAAAIVVAANYEAGLAGNPLAAPGPETMGWTAGLPTSDVGNFRSEPVSPDGETGFNAWRMVDNSTAGGQYITWNKTLTTEQLGAAMANGWTLAARLREVNPSGNTRRSVAMRFGNGSKYWQLLLMTNTSGALVASLYGSSETVVTLTGVDPAAYHEHQLIYDPSAGTAKYYVDGQLWRSALAGHNYSFSGVQWGTSSGSGKGDGYWNQVSFVIHDPPRGPKPVVTSHPASQVAAAGSGVTLTSAFSGNVTGYQWYKDTLPLDGATSSSLTLDPLTPADAGDYWCRAYNGPESHASTETAALAVLTPGAGLVLTEFLSGNSTGLRDEDGDQSDWIELFNAGTEPVGTLGWFLTDDASQPFQWALPDTTVAPGGFLRVWASGKDRADPAGELHTNFALAKSGGYLALVRADGTAAAAYTYPAQENDRSYGRKVHAAGIETFFAPPTPGAVTRDGRTSPNDGIAFDPPAQVFTGTLPVTVSTFLTGGTLRYSTDGTRPEFDSPAVTGPIPLTAAASLRAAVVYPGDRHGATGTAGYLLAGADVESFKSPLPIVAMSNFGAGAVPGVSSRGPSGDGSGVVQVFKQPQALLILDEAEGSTQLASSPAVNHSRAGLRLRGSSSFGFSVKSYALETWGEFDDQSRAVGLLGLSPESDWVLYGPDASQYDITLIHNSFTFELARQSGFNAPRHKFVELFIDSNGDGQITMADHKGLSVLLEKPKRDQARVDFPAMNADGSQGGWMINVDRMDALPPGSAPGSLAPRHFHTAGLNRTLENPDDCAHATANVDMPEYYHSFFNFESPAGWDILPAQRTVIQDEMRAFDAVLYGASYTDPVAGYWPHIDVPNWAHHLVIHCFSRNQDAAVLSAFLYRDTPGAPMRWASIWDFDRAYAKMGGATDNLKWAHDRLYYKRLVTDPEFMQAYIDVWQDLRRGVFATANLHAIADAQAAEITGTVAARSGVAESTWSDRLRAMKTWMETRAAAMDALYAAPPTFTRASGPIEPDLALGMSAPAGTIYYTTDGSDPRLRGGGISSSAIAYSGELPIVQAKTVIARALVGASWSGRTRATFFWASAGPSFLPGGSADWTTDANWASNPAPYPNGVGHAATIGPPSPAVDRNVNLYAPVTVGRITFPQDASTVRNRVRDRNTGNTLTFDNGAEPARIEVGGTGTGYVEFQVAAGVTLTAPLHLAVTNIAGRAEFGALRLRESWIGPGGLVKQGPGVASLTGGGKLYQGDTVIEEGVLQVTGNAAPSATSSISVQEGGQLRLVSDGTAAYTFGGDVILRGSGRGPEIPEASGMGKLGALRYDPRVQAPGSENNSARLNNPVALADAAEIHVDHATSTLTLAAPLRGAGALTKSGGGVLAVTSDSSGYTAPILVSQGTLRLRGALGSAITALADSTLNAAGCTGALNGSGALVLPSTALTTPQADGLRHAMVFTQTGPPSLADAGNAGNALLIANSIVNPQAIDLYLDFATPPVSASRIQGGYLLPLDASWDAVLNHPQLRVFVPDAGGAQSFDGRSWSPMAGARATRVPATLPSPAGDVTGRIMELRFDGAPLTYAQWRTVTFTDPDEASNPGISGPAAVHFPDGVPNLIRFSLGISGNNAADRLPQLSRADDQMNFRFPYDPGLLGIRWIAQATSDPTDWDSADVLWDSSASGWLPDENGWLTIPDAFVTPATTRRFYRLVIELTDE